MKKSVIKTLSAKLVVIAVFFSLVFSPVSVNAQVVDISAQLNALVIALATIGDSIASSQSLTESERHALFTQLIGISSQIVVLKDGNATVSRIDPLEAEEAKDTAREAGLTRVLVNFNPATNQAVTDVTLNSRKTRVTYTLPELATATVFTEKIERLREIVAMRVSDAENVKYRDVYDALFVTARDPLRASPIAVNSSVANYLADNFAKHSILTSIQIFPGNDQAAIKITSDQQDFIYLTIARESDIDGGFRNVTEYTYTTQYFTDDIINPSWTYDSGSESMVPLPRSSASESGIPHDDIESFLTNLFNDLPFTTRIPNFGSKLTRFLVSNPITYDDSSNSLWSFNSMNGLRISNTDNVDCYSSADKLVVDEFIKHLVDGLEAQYEDIASLTEYVTPVSGSEYGSGGCSSRMRFF